MDLEKYDIKDATHNLSCIHSINSRQSYDYSMSCIILKRMPRSRLKILVFGERNRKGRDNVKKIRYVEEDRVTEIKD